MVRTVGRVRARLGGDARPAGHRLFSIAPTSLGALRLIRSSLGLWGTRPSVCRAGRDAHFEPERTGVGSSKSLTPATTGEVHPVIMPDATCLQGWCLLVAYTGTHVIAWQWCDQEKKTAWEALLTCLPAPGMVVVDDGRGIGTALAKCWPDTRGQRCYFHIMQTVTRHLSRRPKL